MKAAHSESSSSKPITLGSNCGSKAAAHATVIDFYAASDAEEDTQIGDNGFTSEIAAKQVELDKVLKDCNVCNRNNNSQDRYPCLVNKNGVHKVISHEMIKAWVLALVGDTQLILNILFDSFWIGQKWTWRHFDSSA